MKRLRRGDATAQDHFVYILLCDDESYYIGMTRSLAKRVARHRCGIGARYTVRHPPKELVYKEGPMARPLAARRERQLKGWSHEKKTCLIRGDFERLKALAKSREGE